MKLGKQTCRHQGTNAWPNLSGTSLVLGAVGLDLVVVSVQTRLLLFGPVEVVNSGAVPTENTSSLHKRNVQSDKTNHDCSSCRSVFASLDRERSFCVVGKTRVSLQTHTFFPWLKRKADQQHRYVLLGEYKHTNKIDTQN